MGNKEYYAYLNRILASGEPVWQVTVVSAEGSTPAKPGMKMAIPLHSRELGNLGGGEAEHHIITLVRSTQPESPLLKGFLLSEQGDRVGAEDEVQTSMICGGGIKAFIEPLFPSKRLYIIGAGHCGRALGSLARECGYHVTLIDNREQTIAALPEGVCDAAVVNDYSDLEQAVGFDARAHIVIMTHGHTHDREVLERCLARPHRYLGMIGSKGKVAATLAKLKQKGFAQKDLDRVHAPIGLPIGSQTPAEIAVSIMAELIRFNSDQR
jgi:xanthine dehydrogenase accessory factor